MEQEMVFAFSALIVAVAGSAICCGAVFLGGFLIQYRRVRRYMRRKNMMLKN